MLSKMTIFFVLLPLAIHHQIVSAVPQTSEGLFGTVGDTTRNDLLPNLTCNALLFTVNQTIKAHPDWREWLDQVRHNETQFIESCEEKLGNDDAEVRSFLDSQKDLLDCPEAHSKITIVAVVFIIAFILALIGLAILSVLYYRK